MAVAVIGNWELGVRRSAYDIVDIVVGRHAARRGRAVVTCKFPPGCHAPWYGAEGRGTTNCSTQVIWIRL